ncbi:MULTISPECIES: Fic family protein [unclassified Pseudomonas]|uniref:Fic family protein n=1 Tax=unclassified Pseudomonas TaxID=196821 RepID=UPI000D3B4A17|nr:MULTISPECIES: Fic family protein [unclassified Pseudomonas]RAU47913.1 Fic family protein [Pseudomonas sp. RIT 409]RAU55393.1 Fic family protein [Pseudomonas sp. RIT 412]
MALTPYITPDRAPGYLRDAAAELLRLNAALSENIPESLRVPMIHLQRQVSAYFSNRIEGNSAAPADVLRAQDDPADGDVALDLLEIRSHIEAQISLSTDPIDATVMSNRASIARIHRELYRGVPENHLRIHAETGGQPIPLVPGEIRTREVRVGHHIPPAAEKIRSYLRWFEDAYRLDRLHGLAPLLAAAGAHHRFLWLHPFVDGNGRTGRLLTDEYLKAGGLKGYGLWSMSRGFGQDADAYYSALQAADHVRKGDLDGRGELSDSGLLKFTEYFIATALEQVRFVSALLEPRTLNRRIDHYFHMRQQSAFSAASGEALAILRIDALQLYRRLLERGPMQRSEIQAELGLGECTARNLLGQMACEGLIALDENGQASMRLPGHLIMTLFPDLFDSSQKPGK